MRILTILVILLVFTGNLNGQVAINTNGTEAHPSSMLDVSSNGKGILIPRIDSTTRKGISPVIEGLMVYDNDTHSFWYYTGSKWKEVGSEQNRIVDEDGDTKIDVEKNLDNDKIIIATEGNEILEFGINLHGSSYIDFNNSRFNLYIGDGTGLLDTLGYNNTVLGYKALEKNSFGNGNTVIGRSAALNQIGYTSNNTIMGMRALLNNMKGGANSIFGTQTLEKSKRSDFNTAMGYKSLFNDSLSSSNVVIGAFAGEGTEAVERHNNVLIGYEAGNRSSGNDHTFIGYRAGYNNQEGYQNTFVGFESGRENHSGFNNSFLGWGAGRFTTSGSFNTFIGTSSGLLNNVGFANVFIGNGTGVSNSSGHTNVFIGSGTGSGNIDGIYNVYVGANSGGFSTGKFNTMLGNQAGQYNVGNRNIFLGMYSGYQNIDGYSNIFIGNNSGEIFEGSHRLIIENSNSLSPLIYGEFDTDRTGINWDSSISLPATLSVNGTLHIEDTAKLKPLTTIPTCTTSDLGLLYVDDTTKKLNFCDGTSWVPLN